MMKQARALFRQAVLVRKDPKYVNQDPLKEVFGLIMKLPNRAKFDSFLSTSGAKGKLSVSETFLILQNFMQIHPLRTT